MLAVKSFARYAGALIRVADFKGTSDGNELKEGLLGYCGFAFTSLLFLEEMFEPWERYPKIYFIELLFAIPLIPLIIRYINYRRAIAEEDTFDIGQDTL